MRVVRAFFKLVTMAILPICLLHTQEVNCAVHCEECGTQPYPLNTGQETPPPILHSPKVWSFFSEPHLHPMKVKVNIYESSTSPGYIFVAPYSISSEATYGQPGALILDNCGNPTWFRPLEHPNLMNTDFRVQHWQDKPVLTFWQGTLATPPAYTNLPSGSSEPGSCFYILDNTYRVIKTVKAQKGYISDVHEFLITPRNTALLLSTKKVPMDLRPYGGPKKGFVQNFAVQEIDLKTDKLLFFWDALHHIPLTDSYQPASSASDSDNVWDVFHLNSIGLTDDPDEILVSGRNTWTIYRIKKSTEEILWRLGGKQSDFNVDKQARFSWQHDARFVDKDLISLFDDNCCESSPSSDTPPARGLVLKLDYRKMEAKQKRSYYHDPHLQVATQGSLQNLDNGHKFIGWGQSPYYSEFKNCGNTVNDPSDNLIYDAKLPGNNITYRAFRYEWKGKPCYPPSLAVICQRGKVAVYASWNGSTETASWQVWAGPSKNTLELITTAPKTGFETAITVKAQGPYFQVKAIDAKGRVLGSSKVIRMKQIEKKQA